MKNQVIARSTRPLSRTWPRRPPGPPEHSPTTTSWRSTSRGLQDPSFPVGLSVDQGSVPAGPHGRPADAGLRLAPQPR